MLKKILRILISEAIYLRDRTAKTPFRCRLWLTLRHPVNELIRKIIAINIFFKLELRIT